MKTVRCFSLYCRNCYCCERSDLNCYSSRPPPPVTVLHTPRLETREYVHTVPVQRGDTSEGSELHQSAQRRATHLLRLRVRVPDGCFRGGGECFTTRFTHFVIAAVCTYRKEYQVYFPFFYFYFLLCFLQSSGGRGRRMAFDPFCICRPVFYARCCF